VKSKHLIKALLAGDRDWFGKHRKNSREAGTIACAYSEIVDRFYGQDVSTISWMAMRIIVHHVCKGASFPHLWTKLMQRGAAFKEPGVISVFWTN